MLKLQEASREQSESKVVMDMARVRYFLMSFLKKNYLPTIMDKQNAKQKKIFEA